MGRQVDELEFFNAFLEMIEVCKNATHITVMTNQLPEIVRCYEMLRIGKLSVHVRNTPSIDSAISEFSNIVVYDTGNEDVDRVIQIEEINQDEVTFCYTIYQILGDEDWTEREYKLMDAFFHINFIYNSRSRLLALADRYRYMDKDFDIPNQLRFVKDVSKLIGQGNMTDYGTCRFNIKNFKYINSQVGFLLGSSIMKKYIAAIQEMLQEDGTVYRVGGDNFLVLYKVDVFEKLRDMLIEYDLVTNLAAMNEIKISSRAGYYFPMEIDDMDVVVYNTNDSGMLAKNLKYEDYVIYNEGQKQHARNMQEISKNANRGIINEEFLVYYQPKINSKNNRLIGAEALCRWKKDGQLIPPNRFIPALEQSNDICKLDFYMLEQVCRDLRRWIDTGFEVVRISVNFSRVNLMNAKLAEKIVEVVDRYKVPHEYIAIELTETAMDVRFEALENVVISLNEAGICTSVDDFGVGYSSLNLIREVPWRVLKLDRSFLPTPDDEEYEQKKIMLAHVISMVNSLGLQVIAEGAEYKEQIDLLAECGCYFVQGFYYDKPLPKEEFEHRLSLGDD